MSGIMETIDERERQRNKDRKSKGVAQAMMKMWELNDFVACLSLGFSN